MSKRLNQQSDSRRLRRQGILPDEAKGTPYVTPLKAEEEIDSFKVIEDEK